MVALQTTEIVVPGSIPASLTQQKALRTGRVTVCTMKPWDKEGNLPSGNNNKYPKKTYFQLLKDLRGLEAGSLCCIKFLQACLGYCGW